MGILNNLKIGPKTIGDYLVAGLATAILAYMLVSSISGLNTNSISSSTTTRRY